MSINQALIAGLQSKLASISFFAAHQLAWVAETTSTNDDLKRDWQQNYFVPRIEVADAQTAGRGQYQRNWLNAEPGQCLMFSFSAQEKISCFPRSLLAGVALCEAFAAHCEPLPADIWLKWPNDVFMGSRKLAGILTESVADADCFRMVVGIGVNMKPLRDSEIASAWVGEFAPNLDRVELLLRFCQAWGALHDSSSEQICSLWNKYADFSTRAKFRVNIAGQPSFGARILNLLPDGQLVVADENGQIKVLVSATLQLLELD